MLLQVAATMAAMSVSEILTVPLGLDEVEPNDMVDSLISEITSSANNRSVKSLSSSLNILNHWDNFPKIVHLCKENSWDV